MECIDLNSLGAVSGQSTRDSFPANIGEAPPLFAQLKSGKAEFLEDVFSELVAHPNLVFGEILRGPPTEVPDAWKTVKRKRQDLQKDAFAAVSKRISQVPSGAFACFVDSDADLEGFKIGFEKHFKGTPTYLRRALGIAAAVESQGQIADGDNVQILDISADAFSLASVEVNGDRLVMYSQPIKYSDDSPLELLKLYFRELATCLRDEYKFDFRRLKGGQLSEFTGGIFQAMASGVESFSLTSYLGEEAPAFEFSKVTNSLAIGERLEPLSAWLGETLEGAVYWEPRMASLFGILFSQLTGIELKSTDQSPLQAFLAVAEKSGFGAAAVSEDSLQIRFPVPEKNTLPSSAPKAEIAVPQNAATKVSIADRFEESWLDEKASPEGFSLFGRMFELLERETVLNAGSNANVSLPERIIGQAGASLSLVKTATGAVFAEPYKASLKINGKPAASRTEVYSGDILELVDSKLIIQMVKRGEASANS